MYIFSMKILKNPFFVYLRDIKIYTIYTQKIIYFFNISLVMSNCYIKVFLGFCNTIKTSELKN